MISPADLAATHTASFPPARAWTETDFTGLLTTPGILLLGSADAFLLGRIIAGEAEVLTLAVHPTLRRQGRARDLLARFLTAAGPADAFLEVAADNIAAIALYTAAGFLQVGRRRAYYRNDDGTRTDALVLSRVPQP